MKITQLIKDKGYRQVYIAKKLEYSASSFNQKLKYNTLTLEDVIQIMDIINATDEERAWVLK